MLTAADQFRVQQLRAIVGATTQWHAGGKPRGREPFPGVMPLLVGLVGGACRQIGKEQRARWWRDEGRHGLAAALTERERVDALEAAS